MGLLDEVLKQTTGQGGDMTPLINALNTLLVGDQSGQGGASAQPSPQPSTAAARNASTGTSTAGTPDGGLLGGLNGLLEKLQNAGHGETVNSWVGSGPNKPIEPGQLGEALGQQTVSTAAQQVGLNEQELLS